MAAGGDGCVVLVLVAAVVHRVECGGDRLGPSSGRSGSVPSSVVAAVKVVCAPLVTATTFSSF